MGKYHSTRLWKPTRVCQIYGVPVIFSLIFHVTRLYLSVARGCPSRSVSLTKVMQIWSSFFEISDHVRRRPAPPSYSPSGEILDEARHSEGGSCQNALHSAPFSSSPSRSSAMPAASTHGSRGTQQAPANPAPNASMELPLSRCKAPRTQIQPIVYFDPTPGAWADTNSTHRVLRSNARRAA